MNIVSEKNLLWLCVGILAIKLYSTPQSAPPISSIGGSRADTTVITCSEDCVIGGGAPVSSAPLEAGPAARLGRKLMHATSPVTILTGATTLSKTSTSVSFCNTAGGAITMTMPAATGVAENSGVEQRHFTVVNTGTNDCTVASTSGIVTNIMTAATTNDISGLTATPSIAPLTVTNDITSLTATPSIAPLTVTNAITGGDPLTATPSVAPLTVAVDASGYSHTVATTVARNDFTVVSAFTDGSTMTNVFTGASTAATVTDQTSSVATDVDGSVGNTYTGTLTASSTVSVTGSITASAGGSVTTALSGKVTATVGGSVTTAMGGSIPATVGGSVTTAMGGSVAATTTLSSGASLTSATSVVLKPGQSVVIVPDGTKWYQIGGTYTGN